MSWDAIPQELANSWDGFNLLVNDVLRYSGSGTNYSLAGLRTDVPYYLRLAYNAAGGSGDFTRTATAWIANGTWVAPEPGAS